MAYARSAALKELHLQIDRLVLVVKAAGRLRAGGRHNQRYKDAMYASSVLLSFAYFEAYVSDLVADVCSGFVNVALPAGGLPSAMRAHVAVCSRIASWAEIQDPAKQREHVWAHKTAGNFEILADSVVPARIDSSSLLSGISYPKPDNVRKLLARLGVDQPKKKLIERGGHAVEQKLTSIHDARAELAHTGRLPAWAPADYSVRLRELKEFAVAFDKVVHRHVVSIASSRGWIT